MTAESAQRQHQDRTFLSEATAIAAAPAIAYTFAYVYQAGWATAFDIPTSIVTVTLADVFFAAGGVFLTACVLFLIANTVSQVTSGVRPPFDRVIRILLPILLYTIAYAISFAGTVRAPSIAAFAVAWAVILFFEFVFPLITQRGKGTYAQKLQAQAALDAKIPGILSTLATRMGSTYLLAYYLALGLLATFYAGQGQALRQRDFLTTQGDAPKVVLAVYGQNAVLAPIDPVTKVVQREFTICPLNEASIQPLRLLGVGPLSLAQQPGSD